MAGDTYIGGIQAHNRVVNGYTLLCRHTFRGSKTRR